MFTYIKKLIVSSPSRYNLIIMLDWVLFVKATGNFESKRSCPILVLSEKVIFTIVSV